MSLAKGADYSVNKTSNTSMIAKKITDHENKLKLLRNEIKRRAENAVAEVVDEYLERKPYRSVKGDFSKFPSAELIKTLKGNSA